MKNFLTTILNFIEKHSKFVKKLIIFIVIYFILCVINNTDLLVWVERLFGEYVALGVQATAPFILISSEV